MNIVIYARFSSHNQSEQSIEGQLQVCHEYAKANGYSVINEYIDRAISGTTDDRPSFQQMIKDAQKRQFQFILVYQLDRFARNRYDSATYKATLKKSGVRVISARENISDDASGVLMEAVLEGMAEYYSVELSQKIRRGMALNAEKGLVIGGQICLGYHVVDKRFIIDSAEADIVRKIFEMYLNRRTMAEIIRYLNDHQVKTSQGNLYNKSSIRRILTNKRYIGIYSYKGKEYTDYVPRIIDDQTFSEVQIMLQKNKKAPARAKAIEDQYLLTTKLFCGHCHCGMVGVSGTSASGRYYQYYQCVTQRQHGDCKKKSVPKDYIEDVVVNNVRKILTPQNIDKIAREAVDLCASERNTESLKRLQRLLRENESATANLVKAIEAGKAVDVISAQIEKRQLEHADLERQISKEQMSYPEVTLSQVRFFLTQFANGNIDDIKYRQALIDTFVNRIYLFDTDNGKNKKLTILCNTQDSQLSEITLSDLDSSPKGRLVEAGRVELPSENPSAGLSTSVADQLGFPSAGSDRQDPGSGSFINPARRKA